jgi:hypothetical protein
LNDNKKQIWLTGRRYANKSFVQKLEGMTAGRRYRSRLEDNIKTDLKEECEDVDESG